MTPRREASTTVTRIAFRRDTVACRTRFEHCPVVIDVHVDAVTEVERGGVKAAEAALRQEPPSPSEVATQRPGRAPEWATATPRTVPCISP